MLACPVEEVSSLAKAGIMAQAAAGWYDNGDGRQRYWDGTAWTEHFASSAVPPAATPTAETPAPAVEAPAAVPPQSAMAQPPGVVATPAEKRRVWPWIVGIGGGLLLLVVGAVVLFVVVLNKASEGPREAVHAFDDAWRTGDCVALEESTTLAYRESTGWVDCQVFKAAGPDTTEGLSLDIVGFEVSGDSATVTTKEKYPGDDATYTGTYGLIKVDGDWQIDMISIDS